MPQPDRDPSPGPRVLFISQPVSGGVGVCVRDQLTHCADIGYRPTLVAPGSSEGPLAKTACRQITLEMRRQPGWRDIRHILVLRRLFKSFDLVHLHSSKAGALGRLAALTIRRSTRPAIVFTPHAWSWLVGGHMAGVYRWVERALASVAYTTIAVSQSEADEGRRVLGDAAKIKVIPNGVDLGRFTPSPRKINNPPLVVCVGRLAHQKGQDVAIKAIASMRSSSTRLRLVGSGPLEADLRQLALDSGVAERIEWVAETPTIAPHLQEADIVVVPSRWDGMSMVLLEAMAVGAPIVASRVNGVEAGIGTLSTVESEDHAALAAELDRLIANPEERKSLGARARDAAGNYDIRKSLAHTDRIWGEALADAPRAS